MFRQRDEPGDRDRLEPMYRKAIEADATYADPHRAIGTLYVKRGQTREAGAELQRYLELAPQAPDRAHVEQQLKDLAQH